MANSLATQGPLQRASSGGSGALINLSTHIAGLNETVMEPLSQLHNALTQHLPHLYSLTEDAYKSVHKEYILRDEHDEEVTHLTKQLATAAKRNVAMAEELSSMEALLQLTREELEKVRKRSKRDTLVWLSQTLKEDVSDKEDGELQATEDARTSSITSQHHESSREPATPRDLPDHHPMPSTEPEQRGASEGAYDTEKTAEEHDTDTAEIHGRLLRKRKPVDEVRERSDGTICFGGSNKKAFKDAIKNGDKKQKTSASPTRRKTKSVKSVDGQSPRPQNTTVSNRVASMEEKPASRADTSKQDTSTKSPSVEIVADNNTPAKAKPAPNTAKHNTSASFSTAKSDDTVILETPQALRELRERWGFRSNPPRRSSSSVDVDLTMDDDVPTKLELTDKPAAKHDGTSHHQIHRGGTQLHVNSSAEYLGPNWNINKHQAMHEPSPGL